ncbi:RraA family protein [Gimesia panareensis]|uniref:Putative 4-hydroxy-4-methyl-2-oxoglutarate aldolase n=1 Tax=Gimesia panareensis TaxID=2527978 RepID=A0A518ACT3_9PLAN|nr:RraA family protein [Gimesia panareensis]QDT29494.1 4-hydroxy-4-methyl-2-oxoglutarate aldolase [Gimesia panareensis]QDU52539.1 4-hydroxy-4-methyl-2-oxoglutarate aldolase [Gimesia panareensis]
MNDTTPETITLKMMRESLYSAIVCDALDSIGLTNQSPRKELFPMTVEDVVVGRCKTSLWADMYHVDPSPYELELKGVDSINADEIFIAAASGSMRSGIWGELLSTAVKHRGCTGAIIDGAVRDVRQMREMSFPVWAVGTSPYDSKDRQRIIDLDIPVEIGGVTFSPGDLVIADVDGIVVVPQEVEDKVIRLAWQKVHEENTFRDSIKAGMSATEAFAKYGIL